MKRRNSTAFTALARWASYGLMILTAANIGFARAAKQLSTSHLPGGVPEGFGSVQMLLVLAGVAGAITLVSLRWSRSLALRYTATGFAALAMIGSSVLLWNAYAVGSEDWRFTSIFCMPIVVCAGFQVLGLWMSKEE